METKVKLSQRERVLILTMWEKWREGGYSKGDFGDFIMKNTVSHEFIIPITAHEFIAAVGREPEQDDLDRCNCNSIGDVGHTSCGWNEDKNLPNWLSK